MPLYAMLVVVMGAILHSACATCVFWVAQPAIARAANAERMVGVFM